VRSVDLIKARSNPKKGLRQVLLILTRKPSSKKLRMEQSAILREIEIILNEHNREKTAHSVVRNGPTPLSVVGLGGLVFRVNRMLESSLHLPNQERHMLAEDVLSILRPSYSIQQRINVVQRMYRTLPTLRPAN